jgi:hypothetical protein
MPHWSRHRSSYGSQIARLLNGLEQGERIASTLKQNRVTLAGLRTDVSLPQDRRVKLNVDLLFHANRLSRFGK